MEPRAIVRFSPGIGLGWPLSCSGMDRCALFGKRANGLIKLLVRDRPLGSFVHYALHALDALPCVLWRLPANDKTAR